ncbi:MAG: hypothetical protein OEZ51_11390 [Nitrospinota bacterium]|nr:hypothetical protein [Nitrospinota bacterium]
MVFGEYLVEQNIIGEKDLARALEIQKTDRVPLGRLALQNELISNKQLFRILSRQRRPEEKNKSFGKLAVEMEYLTQDQVETLLKRQTHTNRLLGEILVSQGLVSQMDMIKALKNFRSGNKSK